MVSWSVAIGSVATKQVTPTPKPSRRYKASRKEWERIRGEFASAECVACGLPYQHLHHVAFRRADSGDDLVSNLCPMCNACHERFHSRAPGWEQIAGHIRAYVYARESRFRYVTEKLGPDRFEARYPTPVLLALGDLERFNRPDALLRDMEDEL